MIFQDYIDAYNEAQGPAGHKALEAYYAEDLVVLSGIMETHGRDMMLSLLDKGHSKVREQLRPLRVISQDKIIMAELDAVFMPLEDDTDNFLYPFKKGQPLAFRFFAVYTLRGDKISEMHLGFWPKPTPIEPF